MVQCVVCERTLPLDAWLLIHYVIVVTNSYSTNLVLELDVEATLPPDDDMLEVEGAGTGVEKEGVVNGEWQVDGK